MFNGLQPLTIYFLVYSRLKLEIKSTLQYHSHCILADKMSTGKRFLTGQKRIKLINVR